LNGHSRLKLLRLEVIQGTESSGYTSEDGQVVGIVDSHEKKLEIIRQQDAELKELRQHLGRYISCEQLSKEMAKEIHILYPSVQSLAVVPVVEEAPDSASSKKYVVAIVGLSAKGSLTLAQTNQIRQWMKERTATA